MQRRDETSRPPSACTPASDNDVGARVDDVGRVVRAPPVSCTNHKSVIFFNTLVFFSNVHVAPFIAPLPPLPSRPFCLYALTQASTHPS
jgi:hypothetical protein